MSCSKWVALELLFPKREASWEKLGREETSKGLEGLSVLCHLLSWRKLHKKCPGGELLMYREAGDEHGLLRVRALATCGPISDTSSSSAGDTWSAHNDCNPLSALAAYHTQRSGHMRPGPGVSVQGAKTHGSAGRPHVDGALSQKGARPWWGSQQWTWNLSLQVTAGGKRINVKTTYSHLGALKWGGHKSWY